MSRTLAGLVLICCSLLVAITDVAAEDRGDTDKQTFTSASEIDYPPFCLLDRKGLPDGFSVELLRSALAVMGREVTFRTGPWHEVRGWLEKGEVDVLPLVGRTPEREALFDFTFPYMTLHGAIVVREGTDGINDLNDLRGKQVAVMQGDNAEEFLRRDNRGFVIVTAPTFEQALQELSAGLHDAVVVQRLVALRLIQEHKLDNLKIINRPVEDFSQDFCFAVHEGDRDMLALLNEGLALVMADSTYHRLHAKWFARYQLPQRTIIIGGDHNYPPYEFLDENGQPAGYNVDLSRTIAESLGLEITIRLGPWPEIREALDRGEIDALQGMFYSPARDLKFDFTPAHAVNHSVAVSHSNRRQPPQTIAQLKELTVGVQNGDIMHEFALQQGLEERTRVFGSQEEALRGVLDGTVDTALVSRMTALYYKDRHDWRELAIGREAFLSPDYCYAVAPINQALLAHLGEGLRLIKDSGEYQQIREKWMGVYERSTPVLALKYVALVAVPLLLVIGIISLWSWSLRRQVAQRTRELMDNTEYQRAMVACSPVALYSIDKTGTVLTWNNSAERLFGWSEDEVFGKPLPIVPEDKEEEFASLRRIMDTGDTISGIEVIRRKKDGSLFDGRLSLAPIRDDNGVVVGIMGAMEDVTDLQQAQRSVIHLNHVLRAIRDINQLIVRERDPVQLIEKSCAVLTGSRGYRSALLVLFAKDGTLSAWAHTGDPKCTEQLNSRLSQGDIPPCCRTTESSDATSRILHDAPQCSHCFLPPSADCRKSQVLCAHLRHEGLLLGHLVATQAPTGDVDREEMHLFSELAQDLAYALHTLYRQKELAASEQERKSLEQQLIQAQKMESVGRLAGGVAHDYNNMLGVIIGNAELLADTLAPSDHGYEEIEEILNAARRSADITRQLLAFARRQTIAPRSIDLNEAIELSLKMLRRLIGENIELIWHPGHERRKITIDPVQIDQILTNLCVNARDAIDDTGTITIETAGRTFDEAYCADHAGFIPGDFAVLVVSDNGTGMTKEQMNSIFEPFFTTKPLGDGTGLGLATVYGIVKQNNGFINVYSEPGAGSTFRLYFPLEDTADEQELRPQPDRSSLRATGETILVVEDDPAILKMTGKLLRDLGYRPLLADSAPTALEQVKRADTIDLLLTDVIMPQMNGAELAKEIRTICVHIGVVFMSGYTANVIAHKGILNDDITYVQKPFSRTELAAVLKDALAKR
ncbi:transporter substrate-binding domain-containing protein [Desulfofustis glycolicus]|uniref:histidine kinase n=1 Tax=Desulfofustis glycolicus DSM 9705 TaxID=1121409 RepID=A0A1M5V5N2_9BACT|nr:transporter substrate-binding domain-containing protein [Desulfofustis glycolicus]MCB2214978.1 transporter substrate-binding domain-containing protein [Desulfobulbaceae bacterium]SHH70500.1 PAS domain S-box-containing protein [Desulfofustis glycolicus DSM 9705]